jgi:hypothetical protein
MTSTTDISIATAASLSDRIIELAAEIIKKGGTDKYRRNKILFISAGRSVDPELGRRPLTVYLKSGPCLSTELPAYRNWTSSKDGYATGRSHFEIDHIKYLEDAVRTLENLLN